jgi:hypothetical protein
LFSELLHNFVPASLYGGKTAFPTLAGLDRRLRDCVSSSAAAGILEGAKSDLRASLRSLFPLPEAEALTVKTLNILLARDAFQRRSVSVRSRPFGLVLDPSNNCQLGCPGCVHSTHNEERKLFDWPNGTLSAARLAAFLKLYGPYAVGAYLCNYGEPLLNQQTPAFIRMIKTYLIRTALSTSLSVRKFDADAYVLSGLDFMVMSIDGATQAVWFSAAMAIWSLYSATCPNLLRLSADSGSVPRCFRGTSWRSTTTSMNFR